MLPYSHLIVLNYHLQSPHLAGYSQDTARAGLRAHLYAIRETGVPVVPLTVDSEEGPGVKIALTFDGGCSGSYEAALPVLTEFNYPAMFLPVAGMIDRPGYLSSAQLNAISSGGFLIGSRGMTQRPLKRMMQQDLYKEMTLSKTILEEITGRWITYFAPAKGWFNRNLLRLAESTGYRRLLTSGLRFNPFEPYSFVIYRWDVGAQTPLPLLRKVLLSNGRLGLQLRIMERMQRLVHVTSTTG